MKITEIEIYFRDLNEGKQREFLQAAGISSPEEANWDVFPLGIIPVSEGEELEVEEKILKNGN